MSEPSQETRSPAAKMLLAMMRATMNIDQSELEQFGIIDEPQGYSPAWDKWNKDAPMFIVKLDDRKLNALAALIKHKFPAAFGGKMTDIQQWGLKAANDVIGDRPNHADPIYWLDTRDNIARALTAAHARGHAEGVAQERDRAAQIGYITCANTRHVTLGQQVRDNILAGAVPDQPHDATNPFAPMDNHGWLDAAAIRKGEQ